ncbi:MAG: CHASE3 domain-containing protein [Nitrosomonadales bacterium]
MNNPGTDKPVGKPPLKSIYQILASLTGTVILVALVAALFISFRSIHEASEARAHARGVLNVANDLLSSLKDAETGQRGYLLTGDELYLEPYLAAHNSINGHLNDLRQITLISAAHQHLDAMAPMIDAKLAELAHTIELRRNHRMADALTIVISGQGKQLMDSIRAEMNGFLQIEERAWNQENDQFESNMQRMFVFIVIASLLALLFASAFAYLIYRVPSSNSRMRLCSKRSICLRFRRIKQTIATSKHNLAGQRGKTCSHA